MKKHVIILFICGLICQTAWSQSRFGVQNHMEKPFFRENYLSRTSFECGVKSGIPLKATNFFEWRLDSILIDSYDSVSQTFNSYMSIQFEYNNYGRVILSRENYVNDGGELKTFFLVEYNYDANGNLDSALAWIDLYQTGNLKPFVSNKFTYESNRLLNYLIQHYDTITSRFNNAYSEDFQYNGLNQLSTYIYKKWDSTISNWVNELKYEYQYNSQGEKRERLISEWLQGVWNRRARIEYLWSGGKLQSQTHYEKSPLAEYPVFKFEYLYDNLGNELEEKIFDYDQGNAYNSRTRSFDYNHDISIDDIAFPTDLIRENWADNIQSQLINAWEYMYDQKGEVISSFNRYSYYYSQNESASMGENNPSDLNLTLYPNPASDKIHCSGSSNKEFIIIDATGRMVEQGKIGSEMVDISRLSRGEHTIISGSKRTKFIKQ